MGRKVLKVCDNCGVEDDKGITIVINVIDFGTTKVSSVYKNFDTKNKFDFCSLNCMNEWFKGWIYPKED